MRNVEMIKVIEEVATKAVAEFNLTSVHPALTLEPVMENEIYSVHGSDNEYLFDVVRDVDTNKWVAVTY